MDPLLLSTQHSALTPRTPLTLSPCPPRTPRRIPLVPPPGNGERKIGVDRVDRGRPGWLRCPAFVRQVLLDRRESAAVSELRQPRLDPLKLFQRLRAFSVSRHGWAVLLPRHEPNDAGEILSTPVDTGREDGMIPPPPAGRNQFTTAVTKVADDVCGDFRGEHLPAVRRRNRPSSLTSG